MRAGRLRTRLSILEAGTEIGKLWADVRPPLETGDSKGIRESASTKIIIRPRADVRPGQVLSGQGYILVVESAGDRLALGKELHLSCTRLVGSEATYFQASGTQSPVIAHVSVNTPYIGLNGQLLDYRYRIEIPSHQRPASWQPGDKITVGGTEYVLTGLAEDGDDGAVTVFTS